MKTRDDISRAREQIADSWTCPPVDCDHAVAQLALKALHDSVRILVSQGAPMDQFLKTAMMAYLAESALFQAEKALDEQQTKQN